MQGRKDTSNSQTLKQWPLETKTRTPWWKQLGSVGKPKEGNKVDRGRTTQEQEEQKEGIGGQKEQKEEEKKMIDEENQASKEMAMMHQVQETTKNPQELEADSEQDFDVYGLQALLEDHER